MEWLRYLFCVFAATSGSCRLCLERIVGFTHPVHNTPLMPCVSMVYLLDRCMQSGAYCGVNHCAGEDWTLYLPDMYMTDKRTISLPIVSGEPSLAG